MVDCGELDDVGFKPVRALTQADKLNSAYHLGRILQAHLTELANLSRKLNRSASFSESRQHQFNRLMYRCLPYILEILQTRFAYQPPELILQEIESLRQSTNHNYVTQAKLKPEPSVS
jgi:hypothetical protein